MDITDRKNILIIEDDDSVAEGLADILAGYGYNALKSSNASDSIQKLSDNIIDLIVLMWGTMLYCIFFLIPLLWVKILLGLIAAGVTYHILSFKTLR